MIYFLEKKEVVLVFFMKEKLKCEVNIIEIIGEILEYFLII